MSFDYKENYTHSYAAYRARCNQMADSHIGSSIKGSNLPSRLGHFWIFAKATVSLPIFLLEKVIRVAHFVFSNSSCFLPWNSDKERMDQVIAEIRYLGSTCLKYSICTLASLAGLISPVYAASKWQELAKEEREYWNNKTAHEFQTATHAYEMPISSAIVNIYLGLRQEVRPIHVKNCYWTAKIYGTGKVAIIA